MCPPDVTPEMACWQEEIFGPVAAFRKFDTEAEALREANRSDRGLAAFFYTRYMIGGRWVM